MLSFELQHLESRICLSLSFAPPVQNPVGPVSEMAAGDFTGDGVPDLAVWDGAGAGAIAAVPLVRILAGSGTGKFSEIGRAWAGANISDLEAADLNADGKLDLVAANDSAVGTVTVLLGNGDGTFSSTKSYFIGANPQDVVIGDFDGNGVPDIVGANLEMWSPLPESDMPSRFGGALLRGLGYGAFARVMMIPLIDGQTHVAAGDIDGNNRLDAVFGGPFSMSLAPVPRALIHVVLNRPRPTLTSSTWFTVTQFSPFAGTVAGLALRDLNNDRRADLAALQDFYSNSSGPGSATLHTLLSLGDGTFAAKSAVNTQVLRPAGLSAGDLDRDGLVDFVVTGADARPVIAIYPPPGAAAVLRGTGGGGVAAPRLFYAGPAPAVQLVTDLNRDGLLDIVTGAATGTSGGVFALRNTTTTPTDPWMAFSAFR